VVERRERTPIVILTYVEFLLALTEQSQNFFQTRANNIAHPIKSVASAIKPIHSMPMMSSVPEWGDKLKGQMAEI
jgi:hypothetical protein